MQVQSTKSKKPQANLVTDVKSMLEDAENFLRHAATASTERASELTEQALEMLANAKTQAGVWQEKATEAGQVAVKATDEYVHNKPWQAVGFAAAVGLVLGLLISRN